MIQLGVTKTVVYIDPKTMATYIAVFNIYSRFFSLMHKEINKELCREKLEQPVSWNDLFNYTELLILSNH